MDLSECAYNQFSRELNALEEKILINYKNDSVDYIFEVKIYI